MHVNLLCVGMLNVQNLKDFGALYSLYLKSSDKKDLPLMQGDVILFPLRVFLWSNRFNLSHMSTLVIMLAICRMLPVSCKALPSDVFENSHSSALLHVFLPTASKVPRYYCHCSLHSYRVVCEDGRVHHHRCSKEMQINQPNEQVVLRRLRYWVLQGPRALLCITVFISNR